MSTHLPRPATGVLGSTLLLLMTLAAPVSLTAQLTQLDDPCLEVLGEWQSLVPFTAVVPGDAGKLTDALLAARGMTTAAINAWGALMAKTDTTAFGGTLTEAERMRLLQTSDCLEWLRRRIRELDEALAEAGATMLDLPGGRRETARKVQRDAFVMQLMADIAEFQRSLSRLRRNR